MVLDELSNFGVPRPERAVPLKDNPLGQRAVLPQQFDRMRMIGAIVRTIGDIRAYFHLVMAPPLL